MIIRLSGSSSDASPVASAYFAILRNLVLVVAGYMGFLVFTQDEDVCRVANGTLPFLMLLGLLGPAYRLGRTLPDAIWSPAVWMPVSIGVFFGFGPLVEVHGSEATRQLLAVSPLAVTQQELFRTNLLNATGSLLLMAGFLAHVIYRSRLWRTQPAGAPVVDGTNRAIRIGIWCLGFGAILQYGFIKPAAWGLISLVVPGVLSSLGAIINVGYGLLAYVAAARRSRTARLLLMTLPVHVFLTLLSFSKFELLMAMMLPAVGAYLGHRRPRRLLLNLALMSVVFIFSQPLVGYGRTAISDRVGNIINAGYEARAEILMDYFGERNFAVIKTDDDIQRWWLRLSYAGVQTFAMNAYDEGRPGNSLKDAWLYFVPRLFWPDKPVVAGPGMYFYSLVTGRDSQTFLGLSVFGDIYWQFGWFGVWMLCPVIGWFFAMMSWLSLRAVHQRDFIMLPLILLALGVALQGMNRYLINGMVAVIPIYYSYLVGVHLLRRFIRGL